MIISDLLIKIIMLISLVFGLWYLASASWIYSKAHAATFLIKDAWQETLISKKVNKPWSWADTWPVADMSIPSIGLSEIVLSGDSGSSLAFGPGISHAGSALDDAGTTLISGHRDTHFSKLKNININDVIFIKTPAANRQYKVKDIGVVDSRTYKLDRDNVNYDLVLSTCYPFNTISVGGTERFIVGAIEL